MRLRFLRAIACIVLTSFLCFHLRSPSSALHSLACSLPLVVFGVDSEAREWACPATFWLDQGHPVLSWVWLISALGLDERILSLSLAAHYLLSTRPRVCRAALWLARSASVWSHIPFLLSLLLYHRLCRCKLAYIRHGPVHVREQ